MKFKWLKSKELLPVRANAFYVVPVSFESLMFSNISDHKMKNFIKVSILLEKSFQKHWIKIKTLLNHLLSFGADTFSYFSGSLVKIKFQVISDIKRYF